MTREVRGKKRYQNVGEKIIMNVICSNKIDYICNSFQRAMIVTLADNNGHFTFQPVSFYDPTMKMW